MIAKSKIFSSLLLGLLLTFNGHAIAQTIKKENVSILYTPGAPSNVFKPADNLGAAYDGHVAGDNKRILTSENIKAMQSAGLKPISYRLRTELGCEAWHWNEKGEWSEKDKKQGYWISDNSENNNIQVSYGYFLPRRGNTHDQANDDEYSRIDDDDTTTFWKSNPYLDKYFTGDEDSLHPQWVIIDLGQLKEVNALQIQWGNPYALSFSVDYAGDIGKDYFEPFKPGLWNHFVKGNIINQDGENVLIKIADKPVKARFVKITMGESRYATENNTNDIRDQLGFAIKEIKVGILNEKGFIDWVHHASANKIQSVIHVSSTDPWHRAIDKDLTTEQAGIDLFFNSGITNSLPVLMPIALLYDTPENMESLIQYLDRKKYPVTELEMGEEPEGQLISPNDYASLYMQWARRLRKILPLLRMGGPGFAALAFTEDDRYTFTERQWTAMFLAYLRKHNSLDLFNFFSTEWYPFDDICAPTAPQLAIAPKMLTIALKDFQQSILPPGTPIYLTEYGYSAYGGKAEVEIEGALMYADILGKFLTLGGKKSFLYGYEPAFLDQTNNCDWGNNMLFGMDDSGKIIYRTAAFYGIQLMTQKWAQPFDSLLEIYPVTTTAINREGMPLISTYAILRPDHKWSLAIINKDPKEVFNVNLEVSNVREKTRTKLHFPMVINQYSGKQYQWFNDKGEGHPTRSLTPEQKRLKKDQTLVLPPYSLTIVNEE